MNRTRKIHPPIVLFVVLLTGAIRQVWATSYIAIDLTPNCNTGAVGKDIYGGQQVGVRWVLDGIYNAHAFLWNNSPPALWI
jgi:hypothetical protein